jgi:hypothetical protein
MEKVLKDFLKEDYKKLISKIVKKKRPVCAERF